MELREKVVAAASDRMVVIADGSKHRPRIGGVPVPVEILPFARASVLAALGDGATLRLRVRAAEAAVELPACALDVLVEDGEGEGRAVGAEGARAAVTVT